MLEGLQAGPTRSRIWKTLSKKGNINLMSKEKKILEKENMRGPSDTREAIVKDIIMLITRQNKLNALIARKFNLQIINEML